MRRLAETSFSDIYWVQVHHMIYWNHIRNKEKKLNQMSTKSRFPNFFLGMVYTLTVTHLLHINVPWRTLNNWCKKLGPFTARVEHVHVFPIVIWSQWRHEYTKDCRMIAAGRLTSSYFFFLKFFKVFLLNRPHSFEIFEALMTRKPTHHLIRYLEILDWNIWILFLWVIWQILDCMKISRASPWISPILNSETQTNFPNILQEHQERSLYD